MPNEDVTQYQYPEIPTNDLDETPSSGGLVKGSEIKDIIEVAGNVDPSRFWIVFMVALIISLALTLVAGGGYLLDEIKNRDKQIAELRVEVKECPQKALDQLIQQQQTIEDLKRGTLQNRESIRQTKKVKLDEINDLKTIDRNLEKQIEP